MLDWSESQWVSPGSIPDQEDVVKELQKYLSQDADKGYSYSVGYQSDIGCYRLLLNYEVFPGRSLRSIEFASAELLETSIKDEWLPDLIETLRVKLKLALEEESGLIRAFAEHLKPYDLTAEEVYQLAYMADKIWGVSAWRCKLLTLRQIKPYGRNVHLPYLPVRSNLYLQKAEIKLDRWLLAWRILGGYDPITHTLVLARGEVDEDQEDRYHL